ncbi:MAG: hypothetical protein ABFD83_02890 [Armatimonadota bacterium]
MKCGRFDIDDDGDMRELLKCADHVPPAPDCRQAVMAKIDRRPLRSRPVWLYAFGLLPAAALIIVLLLMNKPEPTKTEIAMAPRLPKVSAPANSIAVNRPKVKAVTIELVQPAEPTRRYRITSKPQYCIRLKTAESRKQRSKNHSIPETHLAVVENKSQMSSIDASADKIEPKSNSASQTRPVAIVTATWPASDNQNETSYEYGYVSHNNATGRVEECRVKRSGDNVEIYLESRPETQEPPVKRSEQNETNNSDKIVFVFDAAADNNSSASSISGC